MPTCRDTRPARHRAYALHAPHVWPNSMFNFQTCGCVPYSTPHAPARRKVRRARGTRAHGTCRIPRRPATRAGLHASRTRRAHGVRQPRTSVARGAQASHAARAPHHTISTKGFPFTCTISKSTPYTSLTRAGVTTCSGLPCATMRPCAKATTSSL